MFKFTRNKYKSTTKMLKSRHFPAYVQRYSLQLQHTKVGDSIANIFKDIICMQKLYFPTFIQYYYAL